MPGSKEIHDIIFRVKYESKGATGKAAGFNKQIGATGKSIGSLVKGLGVMAVAVGAAFAIKAIVQFGKHASKTAALFEKSMSKVRALTKSTNAQFAVLNATAKKLGKTTQFSASEAAEGMAFLAQAGFKTKDIIAALPGVLNLAAAANLSLAESADIASNVLSAYGLAADEIGRVNDVLAFTAGNANTDVRQLAEAFKNVAPIAAGAGVSLEELSSLIGVLGNAGIQASMAGTSLRAAISKLVAPSNKAQAALDRLGVTTVDAEGNLLPLTETFDALGRAGASTADMFTIFGNRAAAAVTVLSKEGGDKIQAFTDKLKDAGGTAQEMADTQLDNLEGSMKKLESATEAFSIAVGERLNPFIRETVDVATSLMATFADWFGESNRLSDQTREQQLELNSLVLSITTATTSQEERTDAIRELDKIYPGFTDKIDVESASNQVLIERLNEVNGAIQERIRLMILQEKIEDAELEVKEAMQSQIENEIQLRDLLSKAVNKYKITLSSSSDLTEVLRDAQEQLIVSSDKLRKETGQQYINMKSGAVILTGQQEIIASMARAQARLANDTEDVTEAMKGVNKATAVFTESQKRATVNLEEEAKAAEALIKWQAEAAAEMKRISDEKSKILKQEIADAEAAEAAEDLRQKAATKAAEAYAQLLIEVDKLRSEGDVELAGGADSFAGLEEMKAQTLEAMEADKAFQELRVLHSEQADALISKVNEDFAEKKRSIAAEELQTEIDTLEAIKELRINTVTFKRDLLTLAQAEEDLLLEQQLANGLITEEVYQQKKAELYANYLQQQLVLNDTIREGKLAAIEEEFAGEKALLEEALANKLITQGDYETAVADLENERRSERQETLFDSRQVELDLETEVAEEKVRLKEDEVAQIKEISEKAAQEQEAIINGMLSLVQGATGAAIQLSRAETNSRIKDMDKAFKAKLARAKESGEDTTKMEENFARQKDRIKTKAAQKEKKLALINTTIAGAVAVARAFSDLGPIAGAIAAAGLAITIATQIAVINKQSFADGVINLQGKGTKTSDSIPANLSKGESVLTADETQQLTPTLYAIRNKKADRGLLNFVAENSDLANRLINGGNDYDEIGFTSGGGEGGGAMTSEQADEMLYQLEALNEKDSGGALPDNFSDELAQKLSTILREG